MLRRGIVCLKTIENRKERIVHVVDGNGALEILAPVLSPPRIMQPERNTSSEMRFGEISLDTAVPEILNPP